jgi:hypothetical protein
LCEFTLIISTKSFLAVLNELEYSIDTSLVEVQSSQIFLLISEACHPICLFAVLTRLKRMVDTRCRWDCRKLSKRFKQITELSRNCHCTPRILMMVMCFPFVIIAAHVRTIEIEILIDKISVRVSNRRNIQAGLRVLSDHNRNGFEPIPFRPSV